jgi:hypothetical protein
MHPQQNSDSDDTVITAIIAAKEDDERQCREHNINQPLE